MKLVNLIWVLALAAAATACNSGPAISGCTVDPTTGFCSEVGGECGPVVDACTNAEDTAVYDGLMYTDEEEVMYTGSEAASAIAGDCISGAPGSNPPIPREDACGTFAAGVLGCFPNCPSCSAADAPAICGEACTPPGLGEPDPCGLGFYCQPDEMTCIDAVQAAADCVAGCTATIITAASPPGLSDECLGCYGTTVACGAAFCTNVCLADPESAACIECRCTNNCIQCFDVCSGLPSGGECG